MDRRTLGTVVVAGLVFAVALAAIVSGAGGHAAAVRGVDDVCQGLAAVVGAGATALSLRRHRGRTRWGWAAIAAALAAWGAGQGVWCWYEIGRGVPAPFPSLADAGYLSCTLLATAGMFLLQDDVGNGGRVRALLDGLIVAVSLLDLSWKTALGVTLSSASFGLTTAVSVAYPVGDIVLLTMAVQMLSRSRSRARRLPLALMAAGAVALALADSGFTYLSALGRYHTGDPIDLGWIGGFGLIGVAAVVASRTGEAAGAGAGAATPGAATPERVAAGRHAAAGSALPAPAGPVAVPSAGMVWLPYVMVIVTGAVLAALHIVTGKQPDRVEVRITAAVLVLVLARQYFYVRDHQLLVRALGVRERAFAHQAFHDDLTGLPNRAFLRRQVADVVEGGTGLGGALLFCDLDDFKVVNDTLGHGAGDDLLVQVARRLRRVIRSEDVLARLGGDEFAVLAIGSADPMELAGRLLGAAHDPIEVGGHLVRVDASIGVRIIGPGEAAAPSEVLADADLAMYAAKHDGKGGVRVYDATLRDNEVDGLELQRDLVSALEDGEVRAVYQPIVDPRSGVVHAVEVLARWDRAGTPVSPTVFVRLAERLGVIARLTDAMLDAGLRQLADWTASLERPDLCVAVNVSATELRPDHHLPQRVGAALARHRIGPGRLILEVTESAVAPDEPAARQVLGALRDLGCRIALDDFGVGQSSLARLHRFPIDVLKLDAAIVRGADSDAAQAVILDSVSRLGEALGLGVILEGVETPDQLAHLRARPGAPLVQGFALGRPAPAEAVAGLLAEGVPVGGRTARAGLGAWAPAGALVSADAGR